MSGKKARDARRAAGITSGELSVLASLIQWGALPAGTCAHCGSETGDARALLTTMGPIPKRDPRPGNPTDEAAADARFRHLAELQAQGQYAIGGMVAACVSCAAQVLASVPGDVGIAHAHVRRAFGMPERAPLVTDLIFMSGKPGASEPLRWSVRSGEAGDLLPRVERECRQLAAERLSDTPRVVFGWEGEVQW